MAQQTPSQIHPDSRILIVGGGAFGTSTAYHLSQRGYKSIRVLDKYPAPSIDAASTDISKIVRSDYNEPLYARMALESIDAWRDWDMFKGLYQVPGWILSAANLSIPFVEGSIETSARLGVKGLERLTASQIRERFPLITGKLDGWNVNVWNPTAGWVKAGEALKRMALAAQDNGVQYISGDRGHVRGLVYSQGRCRGVLTQAGTTHEADIVILAAGAWTPSLINLDGQITAKGHAVAHIQLTPEETEKYRSLPILDSLELSYFLPVQEDGIFKFAHSQFVTNVATDPVSRITTSIPHTFTQHPGDDLPEEIEATMRTNLRRVFPELADRPFCYTRLCWDADTVDRHFLVTAHPKAEGLVVATGGSAHGFKFLPVVGKYVSDFLEGKLAADVVQQWRWRPGLKVDAKNLAHLDPELDLKQLTGWKGGRQRRSEPLGKL